MKYFYTDPLAAAWQSKYFGMVFTDQDDAIIDCWMIGLHIDTHAVSTRLTAKKDRKYYIHPDSLKLLEPRVGDMITHLGLRSWRIDSMDDCAYFHPNMPNESIGRFTLKADKPEIIQRNGIAFMWPESES